MLRFILSTIFLCSSAFPALAESNWSCGYCRAGSGGRPAASGSSAAYVPYAPPDIAHPISGMSTAMALSVFYPGLIVLMTMGAYYFLKALEPQAARSHPHFIRGAISLSAVWLVGFFPFLSSALGGFLFCVTAIACIVGWFVILRFGVQARFWEKALVFWAFFFFSLVVTLIATGYGSHIGASLEQFQQLGRDAGRVVGPVLLLVMNAFAARAVFRLAGLHMPRPTEPETIIRLKIYVLIGFMVVLDFIVMKSSFTTLAWWASSLLLALPSLAYYGAYWLVSRLPDSVRGQVSLAMFVLLTLFLVLIACLAAGSTAITMLAAAVALGLTVSVGHGIGILWHSDARTGVKAALSVIAVSAMLALTGLPFMMSTLEPPVRDAFIRDLFLMDILGWKSLVCLLLPYGYGIYFILSPRFTPRARCTVAAGMVSFLLLLYLAAGYATQAATGSREYFSLSASGKSPVVQEYWKKK
ncbi:MAG: hypothetical protein ACAH83_14390 [Alphaproteobacteria bacterium]